MSKEKPEAADRSPDQTHGPESLEKRLRDANEQLTLATLRAHEQAEESALRYRDLVEGLDAVVWEAEADPWRYTFISQQAQGMFGHPAERWLQEPNFWIELIHPEDRQHTVNACKAGVTQAAFRIEYRAHSLDGRVFWVALVARVRRQDNRPARVYGFLLDITAPKTQSERLRQLIPDLEASEANLKEKVGELEKFQELTVGRELRMIQLEKEVVRLQRELGKLQSERP
jgi:PAS domain S-box-containing protein